MRSLLLVAHGSKRQESNEEICSLTKQLKEQARARFGFVSCAFLEIAEPSIPQGIQQCIDAGAEEVIVVPYFLSAGRHVTKDIPTEVDIKRKEYPNIIINITDYVGKSEDIPGILLGMVG